MNFFHVLMWRTRLEVCPLICVCMCVGEGGVMGVSVYVQNVRKKGFNIYMIDSTHHTE